MVGVDAAHPVTADGVADGDGMGPAIVVTVCAGRSASTRPATIFANEARRDGGTGRDADGRCHADRQVK
jgi:hypothetical protein